MYGNDTPLDTSSTVSRRSDAPDSTISSAVRHGEQTETLQKLVGKPSLRPQTAPSSPAPMSLAAFIGGRATGPRLNKHAPQLDATDPTLFEQRKGPSFVPHPVFGRGGVAMPGLTSRGREIISPTQDHEVDLPVTKHEPSSSITEPVPIPNGDHGLGGGTSRQPRTGSSSTALKRYVQHIGQNTSTQASKPSSERDAPRPRTMSTPVGTHPTRTTTLPSPMSSSQSRPSSPRARVPPGSSNFDARSPPPTSSSISPLEKLPISPPSKPSAPAFITPKRSATAVTSSPASGVKFPTFSASTHSLPRSEASTPKTTPLTPQHRTPSLVPPREKDPTPSISRLKGRGFVQSMVKASSALEAAAGSVVPEVGKLSPAKSSPSIASRWKPESSQSSSSQPATMPVPSHFRKSWTPSAVTPSPQRAVTQRKSWTTPEPQKVEESGRESPTRVLEQQSASSVRLVESHYTGRSTRAVEHEHMGQSPQVPPPEQTEHLPRRAPSRLSTPSRPSTPPPASPGGHGLGSSSTMFSYIKPTKTGDDPATGPSLPHSLPTTPHSRASASGIKLTQDVDELGHRTGVSSGGQWQRNGVAGFPTPSGRPLVHVRP